jgi:hypothetical protein
MVGIVTTAKTPVRPTGIPNSNHAVRHFNQVDLARRWNVSPRTLERWRWLRQGPQYLKIGGRVIYRLDDIEEYEAAKLHVPMSECSSQQT